MDDPAATPKCLNLRQLADLNKNHPYAIKSMTSFAPQAPSAKAYPPTSPSKRREQTENSRRYWKMPQQRLLADIVEKLAELAVHPSIQAVRTVNGGLSIPAQGREGIISAVVRRR